MKKKYRIWIYRVVLVLFLLAAVVPAVLDAQPVRAANDRYWVGGSGSWSDTAHWSLSSGGSSGASVPGSSNDTHIDASSDTGGPILITLNVTPTTADFDIGSMDQTCNFTNGSKTFNVYGDLTMNSDVSNDQNVSFSMLATSGTNVITSNGYEFKYNFTMNGSGATFQLADKFTMDPNAASPTLYLQAGTFDPNGQEVEIVCYNTAYIQGSFSFYDLTLTEDNKQAISYLKNSITVTNTFTATGTAANERVLIASWDHPTQYTITAATVVSAHADYYCIIGAGAGDWDLSSAGEDSIDWTGNSGITFTYPYSSTRDYYWTGLADGAAGSGNWDPSYTATTDAYNWSTASGGSGAARLPPTCSTNDVYFDSNSGFSVGNKTVNIDGDVECADLDFTGSGSVEQAYIYASSSSNDIDVYGDLTFISGMTMDANGGVSTFRFRGSGDITTAGVSFYGFVPQVNATGTYTLLDDMYINVKGNQKWFEHVAGTFDSVTNTATLYVTLNNIGYGFYGNGQTYYGLYITGTGSSQTNTAIYGENNFTHFGRQGGSNFTDAIYFGADQYIDNLYLHGASEKYRLTVGSTSSGTQRQISVDVSLDVCYCDIADLAGVGTVDWDISDCNNQDMGGNLGITFTTGIYLYWVGNSGSWSDAQNHWSTSSGGAPGTGRIPLIQDIAVFDENSFTIPGRTVTIDITNLSGIDAEDVLFSPTITKSGTVDIYGPVSLGTVIWTVTNTYFKGFDNYLASSSAFTTNLYIQKNPVYMSTLYLGSNIQVSGTVYLRSGILNLNGWDMTAAAFDSSTTTWERALRMGSGTMELNGTSAGNKWYAATYQFTLYCETSTLKLTNSGTTGQTWQTQGLTYNNVIQGGTGVWTLTVAGSPTVYDLYIDRSDANKTISGSVTITMQSFTMPVSGSNTITITNTDFSMATGVVLGDYLIISGSAASGGASFFANVGGHSTNNGGNTGWIWTAPTPPTVQTQAATDVTEAGATLNGELLTAGNYVSFTCYFQYGPTISYGWETDNPDILTGVGSFDARIAPYHPYHYRAVVEFGLNDHAYGDDMTVSIVGGLKQAKAAVGDISDDPGDVLVSSAPDAIPNMYNEGNTGGIPLAPLIDPALEEADLPVEAFWFPIAFAAALVLGFVGYALTRNLLVQAVISGVVMAAFCGGGALGPGLLPYLTVVIFVLEAILLIIIQERQHA